MISSHFFLSFSSTPPKKLAASEIPEAAPPLAPEAQEEPFEIVWPRTLSHATPALILPGLPIAQA
jgi:hypothetical protein